jgi:hypothetical protein
MYRTAISPTNNMTLTGVIDRLAGHHAVDGIFVIGSATQPNLHPASDFDLVLVLSQMPVPLHVGLTYIDQRLTDIIFVKSTTIDEILGLDAPVSTDAWVGRTIRWLQDGHLAFDRTGRLHQAQSKVRTGQWLLSPEQGAFYGEWFGINYNLCQNRRMVRSDDAIYGQALNARLLYCLFEVFFAYFRFRNLLWQGEKHAIRHLAANDPEFLGLFNQCMAEIDLQRKMMLYEQLAEQATAPLGGLWPDGSTAMQFEAGTEVQEDVVRRGLGFWEDLITNQHSGL